MENPIIKHLSNGISNYKDAYNEIIAFATQLQIKNNELIDQIKAFQRITDPEGGMSMTEFVKLIDERLNAKSGKKIGRNMLFKFLRAKGIFMSNGDKHNTPYQKYMDTTKRYFRVIGRPIDFTDKFSKVCYTTKVFDDGVKFVLDLIEESRQDGSLEEILGDK